MKTVSVTFEVHLPDDVSVGHIKEWLDFNLFTNFFIRKSNPLEPRQLMAEPGSITFSVEEKP